MNPLKAYVYCSLGVPIVSSPVANLDQLAAFITFANGTDEFVTAIEHALAKGKTTPDRDTLLPHSWDVRVEEVLGLIDETVERRRSASGRGVSPRVRRIAPRAGGTTSSRSMWARQ